MTFPELLQLITTIAISLSALCAIFAVWMNTFVNLRNKRMDVIMHCNSRYDEIYKFKIETLNKAASNKDELMKSYFRRFWGLKSDQIDYWLSGYVDPETITSWFLSTVEAVTATDDASTANVKGEPYLIGWDAVHKSHEIVNPSLITLVDVMRKMRERPIPKIEQYAKIHCTLKRIEKGERRLIRLLASRISFRTKMKSIEHTLTPELRTAIAQEEAEEKGFRDPTRLRQNTH